MIIYYFSIQGQCLPNGLYLNNLAISNLDDNMPGVLKIFVMELFLCHKIECLKIKDCRVKMAKTGSTKLFLVLWNMVQIGNSWFTNCKTKSRLALILFTWISLSLPLLYVNHLQKENLCFFHMHQGHKNGVGMSV